MAYVFRLDRKESVYEADVKGPFTAGKSDHWVTRDTLDECAEAYAEIAKKNKLGLGRIYRTENPNGKWLFVNAQGVIIE